MTIKKFLILSGVYFVSGQLVGCLNPFEFPTQLWWYYCVVTSLCAGFIIGCNSDKIYKFFTGQ